MLRKTSDRNELSGDNVLKIVVKIVRDRIAEFGDDLSGFDKFVVTVSSS
jgi:hypothetical protein